MDKKKSVFKTKFGTPERKREVANISRQSTITSHKVKAMKASRDRNGIVWNTPNPAKKTKPLKK